MTHHTSGWNSNGLGEGVAYSAFMDRMRAQHSLLALERSEISRKDFTAYDFIQYLRGVTRNHSALLSGL